MDLFFLVLKEIGFHFWVFHCFVRVLVRWRRNGRFFKLLYLWDWVLFMYIELGRVFGFRWYEEIKTKVWFCMLAFCMGELFCSMYGYFPNGNKHRLRNFSIIVVFRGCSATKWIEIIAPNVISASVWNLKLQKITLNFNLWIKKKKEVKVKK